MPRPRSKESLPHHPRYVESYRPAWLCACSARSIRARLADEMLGQALPTPTTEALVATAITTLVDALSPEECADRCAHLGLAPSLRQYARARRGIPEHWATLALRFDYLPAFIGSWRFIAGCLWLALTAHILASLINAIGALS